MIEFPQQCLLSQLAADGTLTAEAQERVAQVQAARTMGDLWALGTVEEVAQTAERFVLMGANMAAVHPLTELVEVEEADDGELPEVVKAALGFLILVGFVGVKVWMAKK